MRGVVFGFFFFDVEEKSLRMDIAFGERLRRKAASAGHATLLATFRALLASVDGPSEVRST